MSLTALNIMSDKSVILFALEKKTRVNVYYRINERYQKIVFTPAEFHKYVDLLESWGVEVIKVGNNAYYVVRKNIKNVVYYLPDSIHFYEFIYYLNPDVRVISEFTQIDIDNLKVLRFLKNVVKHTHNSIILYHAKSYHILYGDYIDNLFKRNVNIIKLLKKVENRVRNV
jgi:hypothetical protein